MLKFIKIIRDDAFADKEKLHWIFPFQPDGFALSKVSFTNNGSGRKP